jgi:acylphosphatase
MSERRKCVHLRIEGRVQGVWFRGWTVRNRDDGSVEAVLAGPADEVDAMIERCRRGPPAARVEALHESPCADQVEPGFRQC